MNQRLLINKLLAFVFIISLTLGCSSNTSIFQAATPTPNPVIVQVKLDEQLAASAVISTTGGALSVQTADGTIFTLTFPDGALLSDANITLTPVTSVEGLPFSGGLVGGVQMAPEGLRLFQPATLTIESPKIVAAEGFETVVFGYHQNGEGLYLNPSNVAGNTLTLDIWHFSGEVAAQATPAEIQIQRQHILSNAEDALAQQIQEYIESARRGQDPDPDFEKRMGDFLRKAYDSLIASQLPIALQDCEAAGPILSKALGWSRQVQLLGYGNEFEPEIALIMDTFYQAIVNCYNREYDQCVIDNDIKHRTAMLGYFRQALLLGIGDQLDESKIEKCPKVSYQASGPVGDGTWSGVVCSLDQPFTINALVPDLAMPFKFVPTSAQAGTVTMDASYGEIIWTGSGTYTVQGSGTENLSIMGWMDTSVSTPLGVRAYGSDIDITLTPLDTKECSQP